MPARAGRHGRPRLLDARQDEQQEEAADCTAAGEEQAVGKAGAQQQAAGQRPGGLAGVHGHAADAVGIGTLLQ